MGGKHREGVRIKLNSLITKRKRLTRRIDDMFDAYTKECKHHTSMTNAHPERCSHKYNNSLREICGRHYTVCDMDLCPDRGKI